MDETVEVETTHSASTARLMTSGCVSSLDAGYPQIPSPYYCYSKNVL